MAFPSYLNKVGILQCYGNRFRLVQLGKAGTWFQCTHPKLPNCSHVGVTSESILMFFFFGFDICLWRNDWWEKRWKKWTKQISESHCRWPFDLSNDTKKNGGPSEVETRRLRAEPPRRWAICWRMSLTRPRGLVCRRSPWLRRCSGPCGATRRRNSSSGGAAMLSLGSAIASRRCLPRSSRTRRSSRRCAPRGRCGQTWRMKTGTRKNSACGCSRASSGGTLVDGSDLRRSW